MICIDMEMPDHCGECKFFAVGKWPTKYGDKKCVWCNAKPGFVDFDDESDYWRERAKSCPLKEIKE